MQPATVVVVDDDGNTRDFLAEVFRQVGCEVFVANDGEAGLLVVRGVQSRCVVLLDLHMPKMDGWEFMRALREDEALKTTPVIVISARLGRVTLPEGISGSMGKPLDLKKLVAEVQTLFGAL